MSEYNRHKWAMEWMHGGGRDPNGRSLDDEIRIGKEDWMERQRVAQGGRIGFKDAGRVLTGEKFTEIAEKYPDYTNQELLDYFKKHKFTNRYGEPLNLGAIKTQKSKIFDLAAETKAKLPKNYAISTEVFENLPISKEDYFRVRLETKGGTLLTKEIDEILKPVKIGDTFYFKNPSKRDLKNFNRLADKTGRLNSKTADLMIEFDAKYGEKFFSEGKVPLLEDVIKDIKYKGKKITPSTAGKVTTRLAQWYGGQDFKNPQLEDLKRNKVTSNRMFKVLEKYHFGNPYRDGLYQIAMQTIDAKLGNKQGTFEGFKIQARNILKENKIPVFDIKKGKGAFGFNVNELAGVTGSAKSKAAEFSQFVDIMEGNLNAKTLAAFQSRLSGARAKIEAAKGTKNYKSVLSKQSKIVNEWAQRLEKTHEIKLPRLRDPDAAKYFSTKRIKELEMQGLDIVKAAERAGYTIEMPKGAATIKEFVENPKTQIKLLKRIGYGKNCKASGGRVGFAEGDAVTGEIECILDDVKKTKADLNSSNPAVRRLAVLKNKKATQVAEKIPEMLKILRRGAQRGAAGIASIIGGYGGLALEGVVEGAIFEWYKRKGYKDEHAYAETFTPRLLAEGVAGKSTEDVPWYGGAEELLEKELIGTNEVVQRYVDNEKALADVEAKYLQLDTNYRSAIAGKGGSKEKGEKYKKAMENTSQEINRIEDQLDLDRDTYNAAKEKQETEMGVRAIEYGEYGEGDTPKLAKEREERRHKEFLDYRKGKQRSFYLPKGKLQERVEDPLAKKPYTFLETDETLPAFSLDEPGMYFPWEDIPRYKGDEGKKRKWQDIYDAGGWDLMDKIGIAGGVANMAEGGIASLKKK